MTTINCTSKCMFQQDGRCNLDNITSLPLSPETDCAYFQPIVDVLLSKSIKPENR